MAAGLVLLILAGCGSSSKQGAEQEGRQQVVASFFPLAEAVRKAGKGLVDVKDLVPAGAEPHDAFGYLARRYNLTQEAIAGVDPEQEPSADRLSELADLVREQHVTTIFTEELVSPRVAETLAREANVKTAVLDPLESADAEGQDYLTRMKANLAALQGALDCTPAR
ncbi:MAG TPA: zinc ABC transporter substrate-binding protein [Acidimicrobiia bacterium]|nr:zinc ABC transporter substrate-binding protein [Acidimicrobiia bacterium]